MQYERLIKQTDSSQEIDNINLVIDLQIDNIHAWNGGAKIKKCTDNIENIIISLTNFTHHLRCVH